MPSAHLTSVTSCCLRIAASALLSLPPGSRLKYTTLGREKVNDGSTFFFSEPQQASKSGWLASTTLFREAVRLRSSLCSACSTAAISRSVCCSSRLFARVQAAWFFRVEGKFGCLQCRPSTLPLRKTAVQMLSVNWQPHWGCEALLHYSATVAHSTPITLTCAQHPPQWGCACEFCQAARPEPAQTKGMALC